MSEVIRHGLTQIYLRQSTVVVSHKGNMGTGMDTVESNVDHMLGPGSFAIMKRVGEAKGTPDYQYTLNCKKSDLKKKKLYIT